MVEISEYHFGAWRENAKELFENEDRREQAFAEGNGLDYFDEELMTITTGAYLYLSGTPFRALHSGEFIEEQIFAWTYSDEQRAKAEWNDADDLNPYAAFPRMVMMTYQLPDALQVVAKQGEFNEFDLNVFFAADGQGRCPLVVQVQRRTCLRTPAEHHRQIPQQHTLHPRRDGVLCQTQRVDFLSPLYKDFFLSLCKI